MLQAGKKVRFHSIVHRVAFSKTSGQIKLQLLLEASGSYHISSHCVWLTYTNELTSSDSRNEMSQFLNYID